MVTEKTLYFIMVMSPEGTWARVGSPYPSASSAKEWVPLVSSQSTGHGVKVEPCRLEFHDGVLSEASKRTLVEKFGMDF